MAKRSRSFPQTTPLGAQARYKVRLVDLQMLHADITLAPARASLSIVCPPQWTQSALPMLALGLSSLQPGK